MPDVPSAGQADPAAALGDVLGRCRRPHLVGVGGSGMNSLATLLRAMGLDVTGSDRSPGPMLDWLAGQGVRVQVGHEPGLVADADLVVRSAAIGDDNPELAVARARGVPVVSHARALGALMARKVGVAVAGTHGKSTTTALIAHILAVAGRDPTLVGGAVALDFGASSRLGGGPELVAEADEYGRRFLELHPHLAVITSIEPDHLDYYGSFEAVVEAFERFVAGMPEDGTVITHADDPVLRALDLPRRRLTYGTEPSSDWWLTRYEPRAGGGARLDVSRPEVSRPDGSPRAFESALTGWHNAMNALAAVAVAAELGIDERHVAAALGSFKGTRRRFETRARRNGVWLVDDYAHHPTAVRATLRAAHDAHAGRIVAVFQPHTTHRTAALLDEFAAAFGDADRVLLAPIYRPTGREVDESSVTSSDLATRMHHSDVRAVESLGAAFELLVSDELHAGTLILTLGAGDVTALADHLVEHLDRASANDAAGHPRSDVPAGAPGTKGRR